MSTTVTTIRKRKTIDDEDRSISKKVCLLGSCNDIKAYNVCKFSRPFGYMSDI
ncbi:10270_t:CDS:1, partial [Cetraspora pellucida]